MIAAERNRCAELVEQIRQLSLNDPDESDAENDRREAVRELCDQLIMKLQPITIRYPKKDA
jgi:hypothetical protein